MDKGVLIRTYRKQQGMKQDDLAVGICTTSYLSRIENNLVTATEEVYALLFQRLGKVYEDVQHAHDEMVHALEVVYQALVDDKPLDDAQLALLTTKTTAALHTMQQLIYARYLTREQQFTQAEAILKTIGQPSFTKNRLTTLYIGVTTYYQLSTGAYEAILVTEKQENAQLYFSRTQSYEQAIYLYHVAFAAHRHYQFSLAAQYIEKAIALFTHRYRPLFQLKLYSMKGVILAARNRFDEAMVEYMAGVELLEAVPAIATNKQWASIFNNMAFCFEQQKRYKEASYYYQKSLQAWDDVHTMINYLRTLVFSGDVIKAKELQQQEHKAFTAEHHQHQWALLAALLHQTSATQATFQAQEEPAMKAICAAKHKELILHYAPKLAEIYGEWHQYKKMAYYYQLAYKTSEELRVHD